MVIKNMKEFLDEKVEKFNRPIFIETDPIQIPKQFSNREDIEIAGFLTAVISWGNRISIIKNATTLMQMMDFKPLDFTLNATKNDLKSVKSFVHRTINGDDCVYFIHSLKNIYQNHGGLQQVFEKGFKQDQTVKSALEYLYTVFFELEGERTRKHISCVSNGAQGKRLNMYLRWLVRNDNRVDFGLWHGIPTSALLLPLDVHTGNVARKLGILQRKTNDWKAVEEVTTVLRKFDPYDPVKYDFALFGLGVFEDF
jgi:uncharacterized protein (TIGR02757 family)